jgi:hypothetical protein
MKYSRIKPLVLCALLATAQSKRLYEVLAQEPQSLAQVKDGPAQGPPDLSDRLPNINDLVNGVTAVDHSPENDVAEEVLGAT